MKKKSREPCVPAAHAETVRQKISSLLDGNTFSAKELSVEIGMAERDIYGHLEHIRKSINTGGRRFIIAPAVCRKCAFVFRKRDRLKKPGRCPVCRSESIQDPLFSISSRDHQTR